MLVAAVEESEIERRREMRCRAERVLLLGKPKSVAGCSLSPSLASFTKDARKCHSRDPSPSYPTSSSFLLPPCSWRRRRKPDGRSLEI